MNCIIQCHTALGIMYLCEGLNLQYNWEGAGLLVELLPVAVVTGGAEADTFSNIAIAQH